MNSKQEEQLMKKYMVLQAMCSQDLLFFTRYFFKKVFGRKFVVAPHHRVICDALNKAMAGEHRRLILNLSPRYGKTEISVVNYIASGLGRNPKSKFIHLSYSDDLVLDNSERIRDIVQLEEFRMIYGDVDLKKDSRAKKNWKTTEGGGLYATAAKGQVTGFGAGIVDSDDAEFDEYIDEATDEISTYGGSLVIDDPIKPEDAESDTLREAVNKRYDSTLKNRINSEKTPIILMMQRVHPFDLAGHLIDQEGADWHVVKIPAILTPEDMDQMYSFVDDESDSRMASLRDIYKYDFEMKISEIERKAKKLKKAQVKAKDKAKKIVETLNMKIDNLSRRDCEFPLWEFKHTLDKLYQMRSEDSTIFDRQYMQDPKPAFGLMYPKPWMTYTSLEFNPDRICAYTDTADQGDDYLCTIIYAEFMEKKYIMDVVYTQAPTEVTEDLVANALTRASVNYAIFESNNGGKAFARSVEKKLRDAGNFRTDISWFYQTDNKEARIRDNSSTVQNTMVIPEDWKVKWREFSNHISNYMLIGKNKYKDCCFVAGTKVSTISGLKNIEDVVVGDRVITPFGIREVIDSGRTGIRGVITNVGLTGTPNHKVFYKKRFDALSGIDENYVSLLSFKNLLIWRYQKLLLSMDSNIDLQGREGIMLASQKELMESCVLKDFMLQFGNFITKWKFQKITVFTIKMATLIITTSITWIAYRIGNIGYYMQKKGSKILSTVKKTKNILTQLGHWLLSGIGARMGRSGIKNMQKLKLMRLRWFYARIAEGNLKVSFPQQDFAAIDVVNLIGESTGRSDMLASVSFAVLNLQQQNTSQAAKRIDSALAPAQTELGTEREVYNITIDKDNCFYANGVLVSNCDALTGCVEKEPYGDQWGEIS